MLHDNISYFQSRCNDMMEKLDSSIMRIEYNDKSPIVSIRTQFPRELARHCQSRGIIVRPIMAPTIPRGKERVRVCLHAGNTKKEMDALLGTIEKWAANKESQQAKL